MKKFYVLILALTCLSVNAQKMNHIRGELLIQSSESDLNQVIQSYSGLIKVDKCISDYLHLWKVKYDPNVINEYKLLEELKKNTLINEVQFNHQVYMRDTLPNDSLIDDQWQYVNDGSSGGVVDADIDADEAWELTTGGLTPLGDTIVICVVDDGIDTNHIDFEDNLWVNHGEIPNNSIDDDGNGYVDDYRGWNITSDDDQIHGGNHGTSVSGIIGAKGNNGIGVSGINWDVKVMVVKNDFNTDEAAVIEAYSYPLKMRQMYNSSNGTQGAFVVAVNSSWGTDLGLPSEAPLWCSFYNTMGASGILNCGATANRNFNIDVDGDLPTACNSDYLITVTNLNRSDIKVTEAGYGKTTIDIGAHGEDAYTTDAGNTYSGFGGTSGATPHVAGAIGLLYSLPCINFANLSKQKPATAALLIKEAILSQSDSNSSLTGITVSEGRLNLFNSLDYLNSICDSFCFAPFGLSASDITDTTATVKWSLLVDTAFVLQYKNSLDTDWITINDSAKSTLPLTSLKPCQEYDVKMTNKCRTGWSGYTKAYKFKTTGCKNCTDLTYCEAKGNSTIKVFIDRLKLNTLDSKTGASSGVDENLILTTLLEGNVTYTLEVTPGFGGSPLDGFIKVWIDYGQDGMFNDSTELILDTTFNTTDSILHDFVIDNYALKGVTRMRAMIKATSKIFTSCDITQYAEVEDYCVEIDNIIGIKAADHNSLKIYPNPISDEFVIELPTKSNASVIVLDPLGREVFKEYYTSKNNILVTLDKNLDSGIYLVKVRQSNHIFVSRIVKL